MVKELDKITLDLHKTLCRSADDERMRYAWYDGEDKTLYSSNGPALIATDVDLGDQDLIVDVQGKYGHFMNRVVAGFPAVKPDEVFNFNLTTLFRRVVQELRPDAPGVRMLGGRPVLSVQETVLRELQSIPLLLNCPHNKAYMIVFNALHPKLEKIKRFDSARHRMHVERGRVAMDFQPAPVKNQKMAAHVIVHLAAEADVKDQK